MDFAGKWKIWFAISLIVIGAGLVSLLVTGGLNLSIDFTGGNLLEVQFSESVSSGEVRDVLRKFDLEKSPVQSSGDNRYIIRTGTLSEEESTKILDTMEKDLGSINILRNEKVDAIIGGELTRDGIIALVLASLLIVAYITWRFEFNFAIAGIIGLLHDVMVMTSFMAIFAWKLTSLLLLQF